MRPLHPCPMCGHEEGAACRAIALSVPPAQRGSCLHCLDDCLIASARPERAVQHPERPATAVRPYWVPEPPLVPLI